MPINLADFKKRIDAAAAAKSAAKIAKAIDIHAPENWVAESNVAVLWHAPCQCGGSSNWTAGWFVRSRHRTLHSTTKLSRGKLDGLPLTVDTFTYPETTFCSKCLSSITSAVQEKSSSSAA